MLMTILTQAFFTLVCRHLMSLMLLSVWHNRLFFGLRFYHSRTSFINSAAGLNAGILCSGT